jgi:hypothetical protein
MSPEQCRGERELTPKSDLYALGILLYEMLTGRKPFFAENAMDMFLHHVQTVPRRPSEHVMDIPPWLDTLVCQLLEKKLELRPLDAKMVASALDEVREKVVKQQSAAAESARKTMRKSKETLDRKAAETILIGRKSQKKREQEKVANREKLLMAGGLGLGILAIVAVIVWLMRPPAADRLLADGERLLKKGDEQFAQGDEDAYYAWAEAEKLFGKVKGNHPNTKEAKEAEERIEYIEAAKLYLRIKGKINVKDWDSAKKNGYDDLLEKYPKDNPYVVKARDKMEKFEAPELLRGALRDADPDNPKQWKTAQEQLILLMKRYPKSDAAAEGRDLLARMTVHQKALDTIAKAEKNREKRPFSPNHAEELALQALEQERANRTEQALAIWRDLRKWGNAAGTNGKTNRDDEDFKHWVALAEAKLAGQK